MEVKRLRNLKRKDHVDNNNSRLTSPESKQDEKGSHSVLLREITYPSMENKSSWSQNMLNILRTRLNNFYDTEGSSHTESKPFLVEGTRVGTVLPRVMPHLQSHPDVFTIVMNDDGSVEHVTLAPSLKTFEERTKGVNDVMEEFRKNDVFVTLRGWREEEFAVSRAFNERKFFKIERSAACLLGVTQYGVHINGYFRKANSDLYMWIARRSANKPTGPGKLDQMAAGGITYSSTITETLIKECKEEASVPEHIARHAVPVGSVSFTFETEKGLFPGVQFIYDLCLPEDFTPSVNDGEVSDFYCWPIDKVKEKIITNEFKPNCALVVLDFLIRHGEINPQTEPHYLDLIWWSHRPH